MIKIKTLFKITIGIPIFSLSGLYTYIEYKSKSNSPNKPKLNIIFDLDETLIYTDKTTNYLNYNHSNMLEPEIYEITTNRKIWIRNGLFPLIPILAKFNDLYLFTKATQPYTQDILEKTNLDKYFIDKKYREDCKNQCKNIDKFNLITYSLLVDDKISNQCKGHNIYHIPKFNSWTKYDIELYKLFVWIVWLNILIDLKIHKNS